MALRRGWGKESRGLKYPETSDVELIQALCEFDSGLRPREVDFIDEQGRKIDAGVFRGLSEKQRRWAEDILERVQ